MPLIRPNAIYQWDKEIPHSRARPGNSYIHCKQKIDWRDKTGPTDKSPGLKGPVAAIKSK